MLGTRISSGTNKKSRFDITFKQDVPIIEHFYPEFSLPGFLTNFGGTLGLWLGVGVLQLGGYGETVLRDLMRKFKLRK